MGSEMTFYETLSQRGVSRRDFLKFCGSTAAVLGLSSTFVPTLASKIAGAAESPELTPALWISGGKCTGCVESLAQAARPNVADIVLDMLTLNSQTAISMASGKYAEDAKKMTYEQYEDRPFILLYEGTVMEGVRGNTLFGAGGTATSRTTSLEVIDTIAPKAAVVVALGACAVDGGWVRAFPNPAGGIGMEEYLNKRGIDTPVVNLPGCPVSPEEITAVVVQALLLGEDGTLESGLEAVIDSLDSQKRPDYLYGAVIHDSCPRRGHFENGEFVYRYGTEAEAKNWCVYPMGCKGPQTYRRCPMLRWNDSQSWCVESGGICIGCATWNFVDNNTPFAGRHRRVGMGLPGPLYGGLNPVATAAALTGVVGAALAVHGWGMHAAKRVGKNANLKTEEMKEYDKKRLTKEGGAK